ncbi:putative Ig domain-containing protein [Dyadobacter sp. CY261]|uniref:putative Ig domain-containing protein n=1 Tax=Dyadobacter sp. CY261 TaxID=2907203 RepID=UPI001F1666C9|nr:putative Ig domain-containing protein [Dyadobacter sp. CY261]MCF0070910.1 putative Ig domain-containing protein [Dyadobacter sp. CY261]
MKSSIGQLIRKLSAMKVAAVLAATLFLSQVSFGQEHATTASGETSNNLANASVTKLDSVKGAPDGKYGYLEASGVKIAVVTYSSWASMTLNLPTAVSAGKKAYVKIKPPVPSAGISVDLGNLLKLLKLLENNAITVTTNQGTAQSELVRDKDNNLYIAVTSDQSYQSVTVRITFANFTGLLGVALGSVELAVDGISTYENVTFTPCAASAFAFTGIDPDAEGVSLALTDVLQNPQRAIDGIFSSGNFSLLQNGTLGVVSQVSQTIYLGKTAPLGNDVVAIISRPPALANVDLLANVSIQAYLGDDEVGSPQTLRSLLLMVDLLGAFGSDNLTPIRFTPTGAFDRIVITSRTVVGANVFTGVRIHEIGTRPPVLFTGGTVNPGRVGDAVNANLFEAQTGGVGSFSIQCGAPTDYTYRLFQVSAPGGRTLAGTLPGTITLNPNGTFSGTPTTGQNGTYTFEVRATNQFGQSAVASFTIAIESALPVTLVSFNASSEGETAALAWATSEETNSDRFDIERSQNGRNWIKIGSLASHKESNTTQYYSFVDASPLNGENLYRLKMVDLDETFAYSRIESLNFKGKALIYPNPVSGSETLTLHVGDWSKVKQVKVVSAAGKVVFEASNALLSEISARNLAAGAYVIQVTHTDGTVRSQRFVRL